ncbi:endogenous retrovirus group K member 25 Pro protein-like [Macrotis lagotis]|uniref:endogenous retrovirus group K member 25 Pro protein-like n=1 Tax=Macrotis lagotis TaxID=92651 RepID=UPI003D681F69
MQVNWVQPIQRARPMITLRVEGILIEGMMDTGADCSVINDRQWDSSWPTVAATQLVMGVGGNQSALQSARRLKWEYEEDTGFFLPLKIQGLPYALWGRDLLSQLSLSLVTPEHIQGN